MGQPIGHIWDKTDTDTSKIDSAERQRKCGSINTHFWNAIHLTSLLIYFISTTHLSVTVFPINSQNKVLKMCLYTLGKKYLLLAHDMSSSHLLRPRLPTVMPR